MSSIFAPAGGRPLAALALLFTAPVLQAQGFVSEQELEELYQKVEALTAEVDQLMGVLREIPVPGGLPETRLAWYEDHVDLVESSPYSELEWQFIGPTNISGRVTDVAVATPRGKTYTSYVATASGGVWKTVNEGTTWEPIFEHAASTSIGEVTLDPADQETIWVGTGEANIFRSSMAGAGVYKSSDGGESWQHMGLAGTHTVPRILVHPRKSNLVYVAASGHEWTDNDERGVYRTRDGGQTWEKIFQVDEKTGAIDLVMDPTKPKILYVSTWQRKRVPWNDPRNEPDYTGSSIFRSTDGGDTWTEIVEGLPPAEHRGRIGIDLAASNPSVIYAFIDNYAPAPVGEESDSYGRENEDAITGSQVWRSDDRGNSWRKVSEDSRQMQYLGATYGWVFGQIRVDPTDEDTVYVMGLSLNVSNDGGQTFRRLRGMHGDHHALWIDPENPQYLVNGNDGGVVISYDGGLKWKQFTDNLPVVQFFDVAYDMAEPFRVYGSIQDHGSYRGEVRLGRGRDRIPAVDFEGAPGGEGSDHAIDPTDPDVVYSAGFYGRISRSDLGSGERETIVPRPDEDEDPYRGQWVAPFIISPHNPRILYHGMNYLFRSMNRGESFERISPDLTYNDPDKLGDISYQTIFAISESPLRFGRLYVGTDDGRLHTTPDSGSTWDELTDRIAPRRWVSRVVASRYDEGTVYVAQNGKRNDDFTPYLWRSRDFGETFTDISRGIPSGPINVIAEDPHVPGILYVGTDLGVYVSKDDGRSWEALAAGLPTTFVHDLVVHPRDDILVAATHGRGLWALDVRPIQGRVQEEEEPVEPERSFWVDDDEEEPEPEAEPAEDPEKVEVDL